ncbi:TonB family protein [Xenococcus sp. PCC 7305]|uniref:TonB family protein n=1 Tax=Xenococcus sp. PCC 7305 TaxID=102125 RepID=UPI0002AC08EF|nr:TonB family protein [Xenococcus sp. PCC 7305]ELS05041.1 TonB family protein [Xenococcus sp. PCC 7305]
MTISTQSGQSNSIGDHMIDEVSNRKFHRNPIPLFILASVLVHLLGLVLFAFVERSEPTVQMVPETAPIDFVVVPPEETAAQTPTETPPQETAPTDQIAEAESSTAKASEAIAPSQAVAVPEPVVEPAPTEVIPSEEIPAAIPPQPEPPSQTAAVPEPIPEPIPKPLPAEPPAPVKTTAPQPEPPSQTAAIPEPILESLPKKTKLPKKIAADTLTEPEPTEQPLPPNPFAESQNSAEILSGSEPAIETTEPKTPEITKLVKPPPEVIEPEDDFLTTRLPPRAIPGKPLEPEQPIPETPEPETEPLATRVLPESLPEQPLKTEQALPETPETETDSVAIRSTPKIIPNESAGTEQPAVPNQNLPANPPSSESKTPSSTGAASLLGGNLKRSFDDDGGNSFFNLDNNASQQAYNPDLDAQQRLDMRNYFSEIKRRVRRNWNPRYSTREHNTVLSFSIQRNGQIALLKVRRTSGSQSVDSEALAAVQNAGPFDPLPANFPLETLNVEFNFNIYIY